MEVGNEGLANVYRGEGDFQKIGEKEAKLYKINVYWGGMWFFLEKLTAKYTKWG